jgi:hypothetical protein
MEEVVFEQADRLVDEVSEFVAGLDPACLEGRSARRLLEVFARGERLMAAGKALMARRVDETGAYHGSFRTAAHYLAKVSGTSVGAAEQTIRTAHEVEQLPATEAALRAGMLSGAQVKAVAAAASADPAAEGLMLQCADTDGVKGLMAEAARVIAAAASDADKVYERIHRERSFRHWRDHDGAGRIAVRGPLDLTERVALALAPYEAEIFARTKDQEPDAREPHEARLFDALVAMADASTGEMPKGTGPRPTVTVRVDHRAFVAGDTMPGEVCEIAGVGPIPVSVAQRLAEDAFLKALITTGTDVLAVSHLGRTIPAHLRTAVEDLYPECVHEDCHVTWGIELDHNLPVDAGGRTELGNLNSLCRFHHRYKHRHDLRLVGKGTRKRFVPAAQWSPPGGHRTPASLAAA